jgi:hypothetical protein
MIVGSGSVRPLHTLKHRCRQLDDPDSLASLCFHADRNAAGLGKRIGDHFKFFTVKAECFR